MARVFTDDSLEVLSKTIDFYVQDCIKEHIIGNIVNEEAYTQKLIDYIALAVNGLPKLDLKPTNIYSPYASSGVGAVSLTALTANRPIPFWQLRGRQLTKTTEEPVLGADMLLVFSSQDIDGLESKKGLMAQAKRRDANFRETNDKELQQQCSRMDEYTEDHYAMIYAHNGIYIFTDGHKNRTLYAKDSKMSIGDLIAKFVDCSIGDTNLINYNVKELLPSAGKLAADRALRRIARKELSNAILIQASPD